MQCKQSRIKIVDVMVFYGFDCKDRFLPRQQSESVNTKFSKFHYYIVE